MTEEFGGSLTPPFSPYLTESLELVSCEDCRPPRFTCAQDSCRDGGKVFSFDSYFTTGSLKRLLLKLDPSPTDYETDTVEIFGFQWVTETALVESTNLLFGLLRQKINALEDLLQPISFDFGQVNNIHNEAEEIRNQCTKFLHYVKVFLYRFLDSSSHSEGSLAHPYEELDAELPSKLIEELHGLSLYIGSLCDLPNNVLGAFSIQHHGKVLPASWHLLHLHLDIHWSILEILQILGEKMQGQIVYAHQYINLIGENLTNVSLFEEHCENLLCSLIALAATKYSKMRPSEALSVHIYPCLCIKEMWTLLIQLLDHRSKGSSSESFWTVTSSLMGHFLQGSTGNGAHPICSVVQCKDPLGFCWWLISHFAPLYLLDRNGIAEEHVEITSNWKLVEDLLKKSSNMQNGILEDQLRMYLQCCLSLCDLWEPNLTVATILWEYYSKHLNSLFTISWLGIKPLASVCKTPFSMLEVVKSCCSDEQSPDLYKSDNSYLIFLRILARLMKKAKNTIGAHPWKQIKGRIYSKFHQRKMQELTEVGLQNFFTLFLLLATLAETEDVTNRVLDLLHFLVPSNLSPAQQALVWRGNFAFILIYVEKNMDISVLAEKLSHNFRETAKEFLVSKGDYGQKHTHWALLSTYVDSVQEVFETSCFLQLSEEKLLNDGFSMLLPACRESELSAVLHFLQTAIARLSALTEALSGIGYSSYQALSIRSWIRCVLQMYIDLPVGTIIKTGNESGSVVAEQLAELTRLVFKLPEAENILSKAQIEQKNYKQDPKQALLQFIKAAGTIYGGLQTLAEKSSMVSKCQEYIGDILKYVKPYLTKRGPVEGLQITYRTIGYLVRYWASILATSKAQQLLFRIIDYLLLPHALFQQDKGLLPAMLSAIRETLPLFLQGLSIISRQSHGQAAYVKQQLKTTIQQYFGRFLPSAPSASGSHPVLLALCDSIQSPHTTTLRRTVMEVIRDGYLQFKGHAPPSRLASILSFIVDVFQRTKVVDAADADCLLPSILKCLILVNEPQVKKLSTDALQHMVEGCQTAPLGDAATRLTANLRYIEQFIQDNIVMYDYQVFSILETLAVLDQSLVGNLIPTISRSLKESEHKRGLGRNESSREAYRRLLSHLGEHGQDELRTLENERC
ncbi:protein MMS22-like [Dendropsophus ebraccatus]|uniref:protein MMS22-like n=1 Tax=Dendropsophus ebraccatus TaxID=150705 RepID=UPI003831AC3C